MRGERFTPETAFHMETTLGLPSGFFDQHHPALAPEMIARLLTTMYISGVPHAAITRHQAWKTLKLPSSPLTPPTTNAIRRRLA